MKNTSSILRTVIESKYILMGCIHGHNLGFVKCNYPKKDMVQCMN